MMFNFKLTQCFLFMCIVNFFSETESNLLFVNVVFRHGDRTPSYPYETYPNDPYKNYTFDPPGYGMLTENGKTRAFKLGEFLGRRYKNCLSINNSYQSVEALSTDFNRTKESLNLLLKELYPSMSIPITFQPLLNDTLLFPLFCNLYNKHSSRVEEMVEVKNKISKLDNFMKNLSLWTGKEINSFLDITSIYAALETQKFLNLTLPPWTKDVFPGGDFLRALDLRYELMNYDVESRRLNGGNLIRKFIEDMDSVINGTMNKNRKIVLYSAHDITIVAVLKALNVYYPHVPKYSSAVIVELHLIRNSFYVKVLYHLGIPMDTRELQIPGCDALCPYEVFKKLSQNIIPSDFERNCENV